MTVTTVFLNPDATLSLRGKPFWTHIFWALALVVPSLFGWIIYVISKENQTLRALGGSLALFSCFLALATSHYLISLTAKASNIISFPLTVQFFLRGAVVSVILAASLEGIGLHELRPKFVPLRDLPISLIVGVSEELSKFLALLFGVCFVPTDLPSALAFVGPQGLGASCSRCWSVLIESPHSLALAGLATGIGFMTTENIEYFLFIFSSLDAQSCLVTAALRVILNLHPLLTGLAATRLALLVFHPPHSSSATIGKLFRALWPSVLIHALFDFGFMFASDNPEDQHTDTVLIAVSLISIPYSALLLMSAYKSLRTPTTSTFPSPLQRVLV
jgi:RsiW-degrading membrane proteinase PrsW (M82 family)